MISKTQETPRPRATIENCEDEPIHIPGAIQNRGALLAIDNAGIVTHMAGELPGLLRVDEPLGRAVSEVAPELADALHEAAGDTRARLTLGNTVFALLVHENDQGLKILEVERDDPLDTLPAAFICRLMDSESVLETLSNATRLVRKVTGYDRALAYMFDPDLNGTVLAEDQNDGLDSYLHQRFPASDIPPQAMRLYKRKRVRLIADVGYTPQPIWGLAGAASPLDLSAADLRAVSPIHIEYLQNMGVAGSLVCTLMAEGEVLGMLACHHMTPKYITPTMRDTIEIIAAAASHRVVLLSALEANNRRLASYRETARTLLDVTDEDASPQGLATHIDRLRSLVDAEGAAIILDGSVYVSGKTPPSADVLRISNTLASLGQGSIQHTDRLGLLEPSLAHLADCAAGVIRCSLVGDPTDAALWFRPELVRSETWAGDPSESVLKGVTGDKRLTPRSSFDAYVRKVTGRSLAWQPWELDATDAVRGLISNIASRMRGLRDLATEREGLNKELAEARDDALAASKAKTDFLANMSHEIRTPMTAILGYTDLLTNDLRDNPQKAAEAVDIIQSNATHMLELINDILDVSKIEAGQLGVELIDTDPIQIIGEVIALIRPRATEKGIELHADYATPMPAHIRSDPTRLRQVLFNLVGNAVKFTSSGAVVIRAACDPSEMTLSFRVIDSGIGMSPTQLERISRFEAFTQADESTTRLFGGTGLGLRISNALATMLGGSLTVDSAEGEGSTFTLSIGTGPLGGVLVSPEEALIRQVRSSQNAPASGTTSDEAPPLQGVRILFAEDGPDNQRLISFHLKKAGASFKVVANGLEAVDAMTSSHGSDSAFDLVLMDMQMPELDGYGATRRIRELGMTLPIIALTAHAMDGDRQRCLDAGCDEYLTKPIDKSKLISTCREFAGARDPINRST